MNLRPISPRGGRPATDDRQSRTRATPAAKWRVWVVVGAVAVAFAGVAWKSARLQLILGQDLRHLAEEQYLRTSSVQAPRGAVLDHVGNPLAVSLPVWSIYAEPRRIADADETGRLLAAAMGLDRATVTRKIANDRAFVWLDRRVAPDVAEKVQALDLPGVGMRREWRRTWPNKTLASQILGTVDIDGKGRGGVEQSFDDALEGHTSKHAVLRDNKGDRIAQVTGVDAIFDVESYAGDDVVLTIDLPLQQAAEEILEETRAAFDAKAAWALVLDVETGAIRAVAQAPSYNPNTRHGDRRNHAIADAVEPGSIFKMATFAAALDEGTLRPTDLIDCEQGRYKLGRHIIRDTHPSGVITARDVFKESSNIGTLKIAQKLGEERFRHYLDVFGFGQRPGTGLLDETAGRLPAQARWGETRTATVSFGHGLLVSSLQMASLLQAIGNGGVRQKPYLVERLQSANGELVQEHEATGGTRVMRADTARTMLDIMASVVEAGGTGTLAAIPGVPIAGKTGTAEKVDPHTGRYSREMNLSSFLGIAPANNPKIVAVVVVDEPKGIHFGGLTAGPAWRAIVERALVNDGIVAPTALVDVSSPKAKESRAAQLQAVRAIKDRAVPAIVDIAEPAASGGGVDDGAAAAKPVPDLLGLSARAATRAAAETGRQVQLVGHGVVVAQEPAAGSVDDGAITITLAMLEGTP